MASTILHRFRLHVQPPAVRLNGHLRFSVIASLFLFGVPYCVALSTYSASKKKDSKNVDQYIFKIFVIISAITIFERNPHHVALTGVSFPTGSGLVMTFVCARARLGAFAPLT